MRRRILKEDGVGGCTMEVGVVEMVCVGTGHVQGTYMCMCTCLVLTVVFILPVNNNRVMSQYVHDVVVHHKMCIDSELLLLLLLLLLLNHSSCLQFAL
jgi:hypothetical protein